MRWGVRDEATDDHMTTDLCMREIKNCQRLSMGPNFVVFLGQKYGYRPIPTIIEGEEYHMIRDALVSMGMETALMDRWYHEDTNAVPSVFILQPISSILINFNNKRVPKLQAQDQATWWETLATLQKMLRMAAQSLSQSNEMSPDAVHNYMMSVTEREVINGLLAVRNTKSHCIAYVRHINNINMTNLKTASKFIDVINRNVDIEAQDLLSDLRDNRVVAKISPPNYIKFTVEWYGKEGLEPEFHKEYLKQFCAHFYKYVTKLVDRAMRKEDSSSQGQIVTEILQHLHSCNNSVQIFQGREGELERIREYIQGPSDQVLVLHGRGGSGKTSLLAKGASMIVEWSPPGSKPILILRFLGTTPDSSSIVPMLTSICHQITYNYCLPLTEIPDDLIPLSAYLKRLLTTATKEQPLSIFLDSVDQMAGPENNKLSWLPASLPKNVKIVISSVSEGECIDFRFMKRMVNNEDQFIEVPALGEELALYVIKKWLEMGKRDLSNYQWKIVKTAISKCTLPIFIKLVFAEIMRWRSYSRPADTQLAYSVMDSIMKLFDRIELQHGKQLVFHCLAYITSSKSGLSETELEDLISLDDIVLDDIYQYHLPPVRRIPPLLWTRIRSDLPNYLTERDADGVSVLNWYHRQFREAAIERYFKEEDYVRYFHSSIADYFLGIWGGGTPKPFKYTEVQRHRFGITDKEGVADRKVPLQPLVFLGVDGKVARYNLRKFGELPFHLIRSERFDDLYDHVLFNYKWLHSKLSSCPLQAVLADFKDASEHLPNKETIRELAIVADALRLGGAILSQYPDMLAAQLLGRLLPVKNVYEHVKLLLDQCDNLGIEECALLPASHCLHTPGGPLKYSLEGHQFAIFGFSLTSDRRYVLSVSNKFLMWDLSTGEVTRDINPQINGLMQDLVLTPDDKFAATYTNYNEILFLSLLTGDIQTIKSEQRDSEDLDENQIIGIDSAGSSIIVWSRRRWTVYDVTNGNIKFSDYLEEEAYTILSVKYKSPGNRHLYLRAASYEEESKQILRSTVEGCHATDLFMCGGVDMTKEEDQLYASQLKGDEFQIVKYRFNSDQWEFEEIVVEGVEEVLQLTIDDSGRFLMLVSIFTFVLWNILKRRAIVFELPYGVRNIATRPLRSQSTMVLTKHQQYAVGGVRKSIYVWNAKDGNLLKIVDAHFGRIIQLQALIVDEFNGLISSSIDRSIKVWNINNIFEQVHAIDRMDSAIDSISMSSVQDLAITVTRNCVGVWNVITGKLLCKLADSPVGAIVTNAVITSDAKYIISAESGNLLYWDTEDGNVVHRSKQRDVRQLILIMNESCVLAISEEDETNGLCVARTIPKGKEKYRFTFNFLSFKAGVVTHDMEYLVFVGTEKNKECLLIYQTSNGTLENKLPIKGNIMKSFSKLISLAGHKYQVALIGGEKGYVIDVNQKKLVRTIQKWHGACSSDGRYGLFAPTRGGLDMLELKRGNVVKTLLPPVSEGVFKVDAQFTTTNQYVIYYHAGRKTLRLFRVSDGVQIANYRLSADANCIASTPDGRSVVVGAVDGSVIVLAVADPALPDTKDRLSALPSRSDAGHGSQCGSAVSFKITSRLTLQAIRAQRETSDSKACSIS
ncbi:NWD2 [Cordylochernes scorpioides]|uniref:NWD2 n=1 Tax=Cordylochernes scorpioides TaxID=51811 RepID=A0ABY6KJU7_9ARAC|nr:NWD2 [Cordylochernes scorpioides]